MGKPTFVAEFARPSLREYCANAGCAWGFAGGGATHARSKSSGALHPQTYVDILACATPGAALVSLIIEANCASTRVGMPELTVGTQGTLAPDEFPATFLAFCRRVQRLSKTLAVRQAIDVLLNTLSYGEGVRSRTFLGFASPLFGAAWLWGFGLFCLGFDFCCCC